MQIHIAVQCSTTAAQHPLTATSMHQSTHQYTYQYTHQYTHTQYTHTPFHVPISRARRGSRSLERGGSTSTWDTECSCCWKSCACRRRLSVVCTCHPGCLLSSSVLRVVRAPRNATSDVGDVLGRPLLLRSGCVASHVSSYSGGMPEGLALCRPRLERGVGERCMGCPMWCRWGATRGVIKVFRKLVHVVVDGWWCKGWETSDLQHICWMNGIALWMVLPLHSTQNTHCGINSNNMLCDTAAYFFG